MCGRYTLVHAHKEIMERFKIEQLHLDISPRYNIAPSQVVATIIDEKGDDNQGVVRTLQLCRWGLIPSWVKDLGSLKPMINARVESLADKPMFKASFKRKRCLIPADSFFEWTTINKKKCPVRIQVNNGSLFAFAGLYDDWISPSGEPIRSCAIITVPANQAISPIHDRMPAILKPEDEELWLKEEDANVLASVLKPYEDAATHHYRVSPLLNSAKIDSIECIEKLPAEEESLQSREEITALLKESQNRENNLDESKRVNVRGKSKSAERKSGKKAAEHEESQLKLNLFG